MPIATAAALLGAAAIGGGASIFGASKAADAQKKAAAQAAAEQRRQYEQTRADLSPYRDTGAAANSQYGNLIGLGGDAARNAAFANYQTDPSYAFQRNEAINAVQGSAAARGSLFSGNTLRGISDRTQNIANLDYGNYLQRLSGLAERGQNASAQTGSFGANAANNISNAQYERGAASAAGYAGAAGGVNSAINNGLQAYLYNQGSGAFGNTGYGGTARGLFDSGRF